MVAFKKSVLILVFLAITLVVSGTTYYVSSAGNDAANGLSEATSWKSITKVNSIKFAAGDNIYFKRGDIWYETLVPSTSGNSSARITFGSYGTGVAPIISGLTTLTGWTNDGGGIYHKSVSAQSTPNIVVFDGINQPMGSYPHLISSHDWPSNIWKASSTSRTSITSSSIPSPSTINFNTNGAQIVMRSAGATNDRCTITGHSGNTINFTSTAIDIPPTGAGFFIENHPACLTTLGDWRYESGTIYMYFGSDNPTNHTIKISTLDKIIDLSSSKSYVTLDGLTIEGGNAYNIQLSGGSHITIQNSTIRFGGGYGIYCKNSSYPLIDANTIDNNNNSGISVWSTYYTLTNNNITNSGVLLTQTLQGWTVLVGIAAQGTNGLVSYNRIINSGYDGINWAGAPVEISYNFIDHSCMCAGDGAGIYSYRGTGASRFVKYNIVTNTHDQPYGLAWEDFNTGSGIYLDGDGGVSVLNNICAYNHGKGIFVNSNQGTTAQNNTCYANSIGIAFLSEEDTRGIKAPWIDGRARNHIIDHNIFFAQTSAQLCAVYVTLDARSDISLFGTINYNTYARPISNNNYIQSWENGYNNQRIYDLTGWKASGLGKDANSTVSPVTLTDVNKIRFEYNDTKINKVVTLDAGYIDAKGTKYSVSITLLPFTAVVLMVDPNPSAAATAPVYTGSAIANATPVLLEMTYNLTLGNVVPVASAFSVMVNSTARTVNTVAVSGSKVQLTLASPVAFGETVTVSYTKPAANPIQTFAGGQATTISAQPVTNSVSSPGTVALPVLVSSTVEDATPSLLKLDFNLALSNILPATSSFSVRVNSLTMNVQSVSVSGTGVVLTLAYEIAFGDVVTVAYTKPSSNPLQTTIGLIVATMSSQVVKNKVNPNGPVYLSSSIENAAPNILEINYDEIVETSIPGPSSFVVMVNGVKMSINSVAISGNTVLLTLAVPVVSGDKVTVSYIKPPSNELKKGTGETAVSFSSPQPVTNNCTNLAGNSLKKGSITIYPNPAREFINISIIETSLQPQLLKIFDLSGKLFLESQINSGTNNKVLINLKSGIYIIQVVSGSIINLVQKLIVL